MFFGSFHKNVNVSERLDRIEDAVYKEVKKFGFKKRGRTLHRFVSKDISQVINFQCGQAYLNITHLMWVNIGIRVPESFERTFEVANTKKYYKENECNIRTRLGAKKSKDGEKGNVYDLRKNTDRITAQIIKEIIGEVLPVFEVLSSREAILMHRREYPWFDQMNSHMILLEEAMIYGHMGNMEKAKECFEAHYKREVEECEYLERHGRKEKLPLGGVIISHGRTYTFEDADPDGYVTVYGGNRAHIFYLDNLAIQCGLRKENDV